MEVVVEHAKLGLRLLEVHPVEVAGVIDLATIGATRGRARVDWGKEDTAIFGTRLGKARGLPRFSPQ